MSKEIILEDGLIRRKKIPVLIHSKEWKALFEENLSKVMKKNIQELEGKITEEKQAFIQIKVLKKLKKQLMDKIILLSDEINSNQKGTDVNDLAKAKQQILEANAKIDDLEYRLDLLPKEVESLNLMLLKETIQLAYSDIKEGTGKNNNLTQEIAELRQQLHAKWEEKIHWEKKTEILYSYLHDTLGHEETNKLDRHFLK